jgi:hypothetical protein
VDIILQVEEGVHQVVVAVVILPEVVAEGNN